MKKTATGLVFALALTAVLCAPAMAQDAADSSPLRIAVVDLEAVVALSPAGKALNEKLATFQKDVQAELDRMKSEGQELSRRMREGRNSLSEDKLAEMQKELEDKEIAMRRYAGDKQREGEKMQSEGLQQIEQQLEPVFEKIREEYKYDLILNNVPGVVVMAGERVNITRMVVDRLKGGA